MDLRLSLQIWNVDERALKDRDHSKKPLLESLLLQKTETIGPKLTSFGHMNYLQNLYQDYA